MTRAGVWVSYGLPSRVALVDPGTNKVVRWRELEGSSIDNGSMLAADRAGGELWAVQFDGAKLWRLDVQTGDVLATGKLTDWVEDAAVSNGYLWVAQETAGGVWRVDGRGVTVDKIATGALPWAVVDTGDALWVPNANSGTVTHIDPTTADTVTFQVGHRPLGLAQLGDRVWVSLGLSASDARSRITGSEVLEVAVVGDPIGMTDPGAGSAGEDQMALGHATGARLMDYRVFSGGAAEIVPEVASGRPTVSRDGLTYTYTVRPGFGFSPPSTEQVTAETFSAAIARAREQSRYCDYILGVIEKTTVHANRITFTLNEPTGDLSARLAHPCASAVPVGAPHIAEGVPQPLPSAGPYYPDSHVFGQQIVLRRNPNYGGTRPQKVDAIVLTVGLSADEAAHAVQEGRADYVAAEDRTTGALAPGGELARSSWPGGSSPTAVVPGPAHRNEVRQAQLGLRPAPRRTRPGSGFARARSPCSGNRLARRAAGDAHPARRAWSRAAGARGGAARPCSGTSTPRGSAHNSYAHRLGRPREPADRASARTRPLTGRHRPRRTNDDDRRPHRDRAGSHTGYRPRPARVVHGLRRPAQRDRRDGGATTG